MANLGEGFKKLGFGLMRLPMDGEAIDIEHVKRMVDGFLAAGFTYFDTAYGYYNGESEKIAKLALVDRYPRESFMLATKLPAWDVKTPEEAKQMLFTSLERTGAGYFDFYLLHNLGEERTAIFEDFGIWDFALEQKAKGIIKHLGFSFHDKAALLDEALKKHPEAEFVQLQINYADWENPAVESRACWEVARKHNKPVIVMEPVKGGTLANLPQEPKKLLTDARPAASLPSWAIRYAASLEGVITVLSGMSSMEQMNDNISYMKDFQPLNAEELSVIENVRALLAKTPGIPCTSCSYCVKDCPQRVPIPGAFYAMNLLLTFADKQGAVGKYGWETRNGVKASDCIACGNCEKVCPQHIRIPERLKEVAAALEQPAK